MTTSTLQMSGEQYTLSNSGNTVRATFNHEKMLWVCELSTTDEKEFQAYDEVLGIGDMLLSITSMMKDILA